MQANAHTTTPADMPPMTPELLLLGLVICSLGVKARARLHAQIDREHQWLKVIPLRPPVSVLEAYEQAAKIARRLESR